MEESDEGGGGGGGRGGSSSSSVYQDSGEEEAPPAVSARVSGMAEGVYRELERLMGEHGEAVLRDLVPLVVGVLEALDAAASQGQERQVELELLREDNEQLLTQYERERTLRRQAEEKYIEYEDALEQDRNTLLGKVETLELQLKQLEIRSKFYLDQISRLEDREAELKKEYSALRHRYTEIIQAYTEHVERNKMSQPAGQVDGGSVRMRHRRDRPKSLRLFLLPGPEPSPSVPVASPQDGADVVVGEQWRRPPLVSNTSLKDELLDTSPGDPAAGREDEAAAGRGGNAAAGRVGDSAAGGADIATAGTAGNSAAAGRVGDAGAGREADAAGRMGDTAAGIAGNSVAWREGDTAAGRMGADQPSSPEAGVAVTAEMTANVVGAGSHDSVEVALQNNLNKEEEPLPDSKHLNIEAVHAPPGDKASGWAGVQGIIETTPELGSAPCNKDGSRGRDAQHVGSSCSTPSRADTETGVNDSSLYAELSSAGSEVICEVDEGADLLGLGVEVENLIMENAQLMETKNALNVVKNDLIAQVEQLGSERESLLGELCSLKASRARLEGRLKEAEDDLKRTKQELEQVKQANKDDLDENDMPMAQRKRFTRVEMARVLMERNQYKERLMELQEAVRWTEMIRASREQLNAQEKRTRSSIWQFFSRLFGPSGTATRRTSQPNLRYNAPSSHVTPGAPPKSTAIAQLPGDKSRAFDFLYDDLSPSRREQKREQYRQVRAHVKQEDGRPQAYGWSLPNKYRQKSSASQLDEEKVKQLPVPVYCRPLHEQEPTMKLWCAAGVNLSGGRTRDGGSIVGASVFYSHAAEAPSGELVESSPPASPSSLELLDQELQKHQRELRQVDELSSLVWVCTSTSSASHVLVRDANQPDRILEQFAVCSSHILCIASVPGARETDYPAGEEIQVDASLSPRAPCGGGAAAAIPSATAGDVADGPAALGGLVLVDCTTTCAGGEPSGRLSSGASSPTPQLRPAGGSHPLLGENEQEEEDPSTEEATEALESPGEGGPEGGGRASNGKHSAAPAAFTEHVFTDPLHEKPQLEPRDPDVVRDGVSMRAVDTDLMHEEAGKMSSILPTMWLGAQNGFLYVHSSVAQWRKCLHSIKLKDSVLCIVHIKGRVLVALADGTMAIFHRAEDGQWDLSNYHLLDLGRPHFSIRCMAVVHDTVWCGYRNKIHIIQPKTLRIEKSFDAHPRKESQVRQLAWVGDGVWVSIRLDSTLRLYHAHTHQHLQDIDIEPYVSKMLGTGSLGFSFIRITSLLISCTRLWVGTGNGVIISIPLSESSRQKALGLGGPAWCASRLGGGGSGGPGLARPGGVVRVYGDETGDKVTPATFIPYCSMADAQLCFHGHRDAVKFFLAVPGCNADASEMPARPTEPQGGVRGKPKYMLVVSGGEGYIDFRIGDGEEADDVAPIKPSLIKDLSHVIIWQVRDCPT
ncbi:C-Jun-amino-terminal kinase-interacting protein 4-like isoform X2 [Petromyzon marinus]|uniref:C-Jun-amino-terminal kinase-interacting protein 4-like isoform X2 n=1 Tax=Petromyzon marinus TaxID=7757 RepID=UPI003F6EF368